MVVVRILKGSLLARGNEEGKPTRDTMPDGMDDELEMQTVVYLGCALVC
jgi:hypothetical protein